MLLYVPILILTQASNVEATEEWKPSLSSTPPPESKSNAVDDLESVIQKIEFLTEDAQRRSEKAMIRFDDVAEEIITMVNDITKKVDSTENIKKFISLEGINRVIFKNLGIPYTKLGSKLLFLLKKMLYIDFETTRDAIPIRIVDQLLEIFENNKNLGLKAHALDILHVWLPNNPVVQVRVMKMKGLEPFYKQLEKLDQGVMYTLMELFNKILKEHINVRNDPSSVVNRDNLVLYQRIGLLERLSTKKVCEGLLNILVKMLWALKNKDLNIIETTFELLTNIKPYCIKPFRKIPKAIKYFEHILKYVTNEELKEMLERQHIDVDNGVVIINDYLDKIRSHERDEL